MTILYVTIDNKCGQASRRIDIDWSKVAVAYELPSRYIMDHPDQIHDCYDPPTDTYLIDEKYVPDPLKGRTNDDCIKAILDTLNGVDS